MLSNFDFNQNVNRTYKIVIPAQAPLQRNEQASSAKPSVGYPSHRKVNTDTMLIGSACDRDKLPTPRHHLELNLEYEPPTAAHRDCR